MTGTTGTKATTTVERKDSGSQKDVFLKLLVAQMKYQDPSNPASSSELMAQNATFTQVEKLEEIATQNASLLALQRSSSAGALVGRTVSYTDETGAKQTGLVTSVRLGTDTTEASAMVGGVVRRHGPHHRGRHRRRLLTGHPASPPAPRRPPSPPEELLPCFVPCSRPSPASAPTRPSWTSPATTSPTSTRSATRAARPSSRTRCPRSSGPVARPPRTAAAQTRRRSAWASSSPRTTTNWTQGATQTTGRSTDFMIEGDGFFVTRSGTEDLYTRAGSFDFDGDGKLVTPNGGVLQGWMANAAGVVNSNGPIGDLAVPYGQIVNPKQTTTGALERQPPRRVRATGDTYQTGVTMYDSQGVEQKVFYNFTKAAAANTWNLDIRHENGTAPSSPAPPSRSTPPVP